MAHDSPERQRTLKLQERAFVVAATVLAKCPHSIPHLASRETWRQLVRAAPSVSYNLEEADEASSDADFVAKMKIVLREAKESRKALRFISRCKLANYREIEGLEDEARQLASIFAAIVIKTKRTMAEKKEKMAKFRVQETGQLPTSTLNFELVTLN